MLVGIDLGYGQIKISSEKDQYKFLSIVGTPISDFARTNAVSDKEELLTKLAINYDNNKYYVGYNAVINTRNGRFSLKQNKAEAEENKIKFMTALGLLTDTNQTELEVDVVSGLPVLEYKNQKKYF